MIHTPIRLIALDLDGTLIDDEQKSSPRVMRSIAQVQEHSIAVTLATGRSPLATRRFSEALHINTPLICYQGGMIAEADGRVLHRIALDRNLAAQVISLAQSRGWHVTLFQDGLLYLTEFRYPTEFYGGLLNPSAQLVPDLYRLLDHDPDKVLIVAEENSDEIYAEMHARFDDQMQIVRSHALFIEASPAGVDKGMGLAWLADHLSVPQSQVMAVGDQDNDAPMVAWAGLGVAMGNGSVSCKAAADWIAPPISDDGAAVAIERFVLNDHH